MATFFSQLAQDLESATKHANALGRALPRGTAPAVGTGGGGMPSSVARDIATIRADQQRIRNQLASSSDDFMIETFLRTKTR